MGMLNSIKSKTGGADMKKSIERVLKIQAALNELVYEMDRMDGWTDKECADRVLSEDMDALRKHIDNAAGRASTIIHDLRRIG